MSVTRYRLQWRKGWPRNQRGRERSDFDDRPRAQAQESMGIEAHQSPAPCCFAGFTAARVAGASKRPLPFVSFAVFV